MARARKAHSGGRKKRIMLSRLALSLWLGRARARRRGAGKCTLLGAAWACCACLCVGAPGRTLTATRARGSLARSLCECVVM